MSSKRESVLKIFALGWVWLFIACSDESSDPIGMPEPEKGRQDSSYLVAHLKLEGPINDLWGYLDPVSQQKLILVGFGRAGRLDETTGIYFINVDNVNDPKLIQTLNFVGGFDMKIFDNYLYTVSGTQGTHGSIIDISTIEQPDITGTFPDGHNLFIDPSGLMVLCTQNFPATRLYSLKQDPEVPEFLWSDQLQGGHDAIIVGNRLYDFHGLDGTLIYDLNDPAQPELLGSVITEPTITNFHHSGWVNHQSNVLLINDERPKGNGMVDVADMAIWNISDPASPILINTHRDTSATIHNVQIRGSSAYVSYYTSGYREFDISNPESIREVVIFDTTPEEEGKGRLMGAFGIYSLFNDGYVYISDIQNGLFVFRM